MSQIKEAELEGLRKVRPSGVDRMVTCPASIHTENDEVIIDHESGTPARIGSATHAVLKVFLGEKMKDIPDVTPFAIAEGVEEEIEKVRIFSYLGRRFLHEKGYAKFLSDEPLLEQPLKILGPEGSGYYFSLRPDVLDLVVGNDDVRRVFVFDYKTGEERPDRETLGQMKSYGYAGLRYFESYGPVDEVVVVVAWLQTGKETVRKYKVEEIESFAEELPESFEWDGKTFTPGNACRWCPRVARCQGRAELLHSGIEILSGESPSSRDLIPYTPGKIANVEEWAQAIVQAKLLKTEIDRFLADSCLAAKLHGGELPFDGGVIRVKMTKGGAKLDPGATIIHLAKLKEEKLGSELPLTIADVLSMSKLNKKGVEDFIKTLAPRGEKGNLVESVLEDLEKKGHLTRSRNREWVEVV